MLVLDSIYQFLSELQSVFLFNSADGERSASSDQTSPICLDHCSGPLGWVSGSQLICMPCAAAACQLLELHHVNQVSAAEHTEHQFWNIPGLQLSDLTVWIHHLFVISH